MVITSASHAEGHEFEPRQNLFFNHNNPVYCYILIVRSQETFKNIFFSKSCIREKKGKKKICQKWDSNPRPHSWTRTLVSDLCNQKVINLESGALDHSAILTMSYLAILHTWCVNLHNNKLQNVTMVLTGEHSSHLCVH